VFLLWIKTEETKWNLDFFDNDRELQENIAEEINAAIDNEDIDMTAKEENEDEFSPTWKRKNY
jgi:hypothetical protein